MRSCNDKRSLPWQFGGEASLGERIGVITKSSQTLPRPATLLLLGVIVASVSPAEDPAGCQLATLRNGFTIQYARSEVAGQTTRLWLCADAGSGYLEVSSAEIVGHEAIPKAPSPAPPAIPKTPKTAAKDPLEKLIAGAAWRQGIDPDFVTSVVKAESGFNPAVVSPKGAQGLMQLMPQTAASLGVGNVLDPAANVEGGTKYLRQLLDQYDGDAAKALAAYNAGPQRVEQYGGIPPYPETRAYVARIINDFNRKKLQQQAHSATAPANE